MSEPTDHEKRLREADAMAALAAETSEPPLWQALADALNALADYGLDPIAGLCEQLGAPPVTVIDAGDVIHGASKRIGGKQLRWLGAGGNDEHEFGSKWIVADRTDDVDGGASDA